MRVFLYVVKVCIGVGKFCVKSSYGIFKLLIFKRL